MSHTSEKQKIAYALVRVSTSIQKSDSQAADIVRIADEMGYSILPEYIFEEKISGYDENYNDDRESIVQLKRAIRVRKPDAIFCWELSRLTRTPDKVEKYISELSLQPQIPLYIYKFGKGGIWTMEDGRILFENTKAIRAAADAVYEELQQIRERTMRGRADKARLGKYVGHLADGYLVDRNGFFYIDEVRKPDIERIFKLYGDHNYSTDEVAKILNRECIKTTNHYRATSDFFPNYEVIYKSKSKKKKVERVIDRTKMVWSGEMVSMTLKNSWYRGKRKYVIDKKEKLEFDIEPLIKDKSLISRVDEKLSQNRIYHNSTASKHKYLLSGLLFCGVCGRPMYGHCTGLFNHYYCSSIETGEKCGCRGIRKENVEAIVIERIRYWAYFDAVSNEPSSVFVNIYKNDDSIKEYHDKIKVAEASIGLSLSRIEQQKTIQDNYFYAIGNCNNKESIARFTALIDKADREIENENENIFQQKKLSNLYKQKIKRLKDVKHIVQRIEDATKTDDYIDVIKTIIEKILIYNTDANSSVLRIFYTNGQYEDIIYSYRLLKEGYIPLIGVCNLFSTEQRKLCFPGNWLMFERLGISVITNDDYKKFIKSVNRNPQKPEKASVLARMRPLKTYKDEVSINEFIRDIRQFHNRLVFHFVAEMPEGARAEKQRKYQKERTEQQRTGLPTGLPRLDSNFDNESIQKECKRLYNRIYKIKKNKSLTNEQKEQQIEVIKEKLSALGAKKKYLTRQEQVERYLSAKEQNS